MKNMEYNDNDKIAIFLRDIKLEFMDFEFPVKRTAKMSR
jgi:hypothetical protein